MEQNYNDIYTIDLSYATSASDVVYELSSIIDNDRAKNQKIILKLGSIDLNQSQLLSIRSLINSINSSVDILETSSSQTEIAAINLGIIVSSVKKEEPVQTQQDAEIAEPTYVQSYGYVKLEDHILDEEEEETKADSEESEENSQESGEQEKTEEKTEEDSTAVINEEEPSESEEVSSVVMAISEEQAEEIIEAKTEDIQDALDNIYTAEVKLESILESDQKIEEGVISSEEIKLAILKEEKYTEEDFEIDHFSTTYIKQTLRSGQIVNYDGNVVIIGDCHPGSEVVASGDITVWGILSGIAHAGAKGNSRAKVRALKMNAIQLRIASCYARKPDGMNTIFPERTSTFTPEEARVINNEIVIFKIND